jgi:hypothetical protein
MFRIENSPFLIRYVSTFANPTREDGHGEFVDELKPMRDRVTPADLRDLRSLLQRDLSDKRVANDLVPYLKGLTQSGIGFFPAILAVIVPKGYLLDNDQRPPYPKPTKKDEGKVIDYDGCWTVEHYRVSKVIVPVGRFKIVESKTDIIVLDGQHRSNAFRYVSGKFNPDGSIYQTFYQKLGKGGTLSADLPVTLIWFESEGVEIDPMLISRKLFVDVNNTAKPVSLARTYLLDDRRVSCIGTQELYNHAASRGYAPDQFSLLHSAFDMDTDLAKAPVPCCALTTPEIIESVLQFALLGGNAFNDLSCWRVQRLHRQTNRARFNNIWPRFRGLEAVGTGDEDDTFVGIPNPADSEAFRKLFRDDYQPALLSLFDNFKLLEAHYQACEKVANWAKKEKNTTIQEVWKKVFCGGEGLYWALRDAEDSERSRGYRDAIKEVENQFHKERAAAFGDKENTAQVYASFVSKAFQIGLAMTVEHLAYADGENHVTKADLLLNTLNDYGSAQWVAVITELWPVVRPGISTDPKSWPAYRNIFLRMFDDGEKNLYSEENLDDSPDWHLCDVLVNRAAKAYFDSNGESITPSERKKRARTEVEKATTILKNCDLTPLWGDDPSSVITKADAAFQAKLTDLATNG